MTLSLGSTFWPTSRQGIRPTLLPFETNLARMLRDALARDRKQWMSKAKDDPQGERKGHASAQRAIGAW